MSGTAPPVLWTPSPERLERAWLTQYRHWLEPRLGRTFASYDELWRWSVDDVDAFWLSVWDFFDVQADGSPERVLGKREMPGAEWFPDVALNYAEHVFRDRDPAAVAIRHAGEERAPAELTWAELHALTARIAAGLRAQGVTRGDRVVAYLPNVPEAIAAMLACASIGAVWSSCSPDFGAPSVVDRFAQIEPTVLLAVDGYRYNGRAFDRREVVDGPAGADAEPEGDRPPALPRSAGDTRRHPRVGGLPRRRRRRARPALRARPVRRTRCGSSTPPARPASPRPSCRATAGSCWSS